MTYDIIVRPHARNDKKRFEKPAILVPENAVCMGTVG